MISLSYVITTRNKLPMLQQVMNRLLAHIQPDEEIIIIDAASTDGTVEYLKELYDSGKINKVISEPDKGEAHGYNKGLLLARGEVIKLITDDDAFYWRNIQACKEFMLTHPEVDVLGSEGAGADWSLANPFRQSAYYIDYQEWINRSTPFSFSGLGLMLRRRSLSVTGLFQPGWIWVDAEFSLKVTSGVANLAWYTGYTWVRITNPQSNSVTQSQRMYSEGQKLKQFYLGEDKINLGNALQPIRRYLAPLKKLVKAQRSPSGDSYKFLPKDWSSTFELCDRWLGEQNEQYKGEFLHKK